MVFEMIPKLETLTEWTGGYTNATWCVVAEQVAGIWGLKKVSRANLNKYVSDMRPEVDGWNIAFKTYDGLDTYFEIDYSNDNLISHFQHTFNGIAYFAGGTQIPFTQTHHWQQNVGQITNGDYQWRIITGNLNLEKRLSGAWVSVFSEFNNGIMNSKDGFAIGGNQFVDQHGPSIDLGDIGGAGKSCALYADGAYKAGLGLNGEFQVDRTQGLYLRGTMDTNTTGDVRIRKSGANSTVLEHYDGASWNQLAIWTFIP